MTYTTYLRRYDLYSILLPCIERFLEMRVTRVLVGQATLPIPRKQGDICVSVRGAEYPSGASYSISLRELVRHLQPIGCLQCPSEGLSSYEYSKAPPAYEGQGSN